MRLSILAAELVDTARGLRRRPAVPLLLAGVVAVGVAFLVTAFTVIDALRWRDTPYGPQDRFVLLGEVTHLAATPPTPYLRADTYAGYQAAHARGLLPVFEGLVPLQERRASLTLDGQATSVTATWLLPGAFPLLQGVPLLGRTPADPDGAARLAREIAIGEALWTRQFGRHPDVLGRRVTLDGEPAVIVGVMPVPFRFHRTSEVWVAWSPAELTADPTASFVVIGRLAPGRTRDDVGGYTWPIRLAVREARVPVDTTSRGSLNRGLYGREQVPSVLATTILGAMALVLVAACLNLATLYLARLRRRLPALATRQALGAGPGGVLRHLLLEVGLLVAAGGLAAAVVAGWGLGHLRQRMASVVLAWVDFGVDARGVALTLLTLGLALLVVALPAVRLVRRLDLARLLTHQGVLGGAPRHGRGASALIAAQVAVVVVLTAAALPIAVSAVKLAGVRSGLADAELVRVDVGLAGAAYADEEARAAYGRRVRQAVGASPAVAGVARVNAFREWRAERAGLPTPSWSDTLYTDAGPEPLPRRRSWRAWESVVSADYFAVAGLPVLAGRAFDESADAGGEPVAVLGAVTAQDFFPGQSAIGRRFRRGAAGPWVRVVGVVGDERAIWEEWSGTTVEPDPRIYLFEAQAVPSGTTFYVRVRQPGGADAAAVRAVRALVEGVDPTQPVAEARRLADVFALPRVQRQWLAVVLGSAAGATVLLALTGVVGLVLFYTTARLPELALRLALGGPTWRVAWLVARGTLRSVAIGLACGALLLAIIQDGIRRFTVETSTLAPEVLALIALAVLLVAVVALAVPLRHLRRLTPSQLLRLDG